jgi:serine/threonine protein kinase
MLGGLPLMSDLDPQLDQRERLKLVERLEPVETAKVDETGPAAESESLPEAAGEQAAVESVSKDKKIDWLPDYDVLEKVGEGSFTCVYKVKRKGIDQIFAAKVLQSDFAKNPRTAKRFLLEAKKAINLTNPHLVSVYEVGKTSTGEPFLICDCFDGGTLADRLGQTGRLSQVEVLDLFLQVCDGLQCAHKNNMVHRDIKPANIVFQSGVGAHLAKIADLGIAKAMPGSGRETKYFTPEGDAFGNPTYMSPEHVTGARLDGRADIYSLGCVMYECLSGKPPFYGGNSVKLAMRQVNEKAEPLCSRAPEVKISRGMEMVVMRMIEKNAADRYQSVNELLEDLALVRGGGMPRPAPPRMVTGSDDEIETVAKKSKIEKARLASADYSNQNNFEPAAGIINFNREMARTSIEQSLETGPCEMPGPVSLLADWLSDRFFAWREKLEDPFLSASGEDDSSRATLAERAAAFFERKRKETKEVFADKPFLLSMSAISLLISGIVLSFSWERPIRFDFIAHHGPGYFASHKHVFANRKAGRPPAVYYSHKSVFADGGFGWTAVQGESMLFDLKSNVLFYYPKGFFHEALQEAVSNGEDLSGAFLFGQDLSGLYLPNARLHGARLSTASLRAANLAGADLSDAQLVGADLSLSELAGVNLTGANLNKANLDQAHIDPDNLIHGLAQESTLFGTSRSDLPTDIPGDSTSLQHWAEP